MDEIKTIRIIGFSGALQDYYQDTLTINRDGKVEYSGNYSGLDISWSVKSNNPSVGYEIVFSSLCILLMQETFTNIVLDKSKGGYKIEFMTDFEEYSYTFYGTMDLNNQSDIKNFLLGIIPSFEEIPPYLETKSEQVKEKDNIVM